MKGYIYKIFNEFDDKIYIGQTINIEKRWWKHISVARTSFAYKSYLYAAMNKYGCENFHIEIVEECFKEEKEFNTIIDAGKFISNIFTLNYGTVRNNITMAMRENKSAYGFLWKTKPI